MAFWRRKKDEFVSLGLSGSAGESSPAPQTENEPQTQTVKVAALEPEKATANAPWQTSVLGLDLSIEQLYDSALVQEGLHPNPAEMLPRIQRLLALAAAKN